jgi:hypothetical protein
MSTVLKYLSSTEVFESTAKERIAYLKCYNSLTSASELLATPPDFIGARRSVWYIDNTPLLSEMQC